MYVYIPPTDCVLFCSSGEETGRLFYLGDNDELGLNGIYQVWEDIYDLIIRDYVTDVYVDVMETFIGASIKVKQLDWSLQLFFSVNANSSSDGRHSGRSSS